MMRAVIFDMDGVLFDTERLCADCWFEIAGEMGLPTEPVGRAIYACVGLNLNDTRSVVADILGADFPYEDYRLRVSARMTQRMERDGIPVKPGVKEVLRFLKDSGYRIAIASSSRQETVRHHLEKAGIALFFETITSGDMVEHSKPLPDIYLKACESVGLAPQECYAVEDSPNGVRSAHSAGMQVIMVPDLIQPDEEIRSRICAQCESLFNVIKYLQK